MKAQTSSRTAEMVAFARAVETSLGEGVRLFSDPFAKHFLPPTLRFAYRLSRVPLLGAMIQRIGNWLVPGGFGYVAGRTLFIDRALLDAVAEGTDQIVILGAGYDTRAYRLPELIQAVTFEVDHPDTQRRKQKVIDQHGSRPKTNVHYVAIDFDRESLAARMAESGFIPGARNFFIWEGVTQFLRPESVDATLDFMVRISRPGSLIAFTYVDSGLILGTKPFPDAVRLAREVRRSGEPFQFGIEPADLERFLGERGLELVDHIGNDGFVERFFAPEGRLLCSVEHERAVLARVAG